MGFVCSVLYSEALAPFLLWVTETMDGLRSHSHWPPGNRRAQRCPPAIRSLCSFLIDALTNSGELWNHISSLLTSRLDPPRQHLFNPRANFSLIWGKPVCSLPNSGTVGDGALLLLQSHQIYQFLPNCCESEMKNSKLLLFLSLFLGIGTRMIYELQCATLWSKYL